MEKSDYQVNVHFVENSFKVYNFCNCDKSSYSYALLQKLIYDETEVSIKD
jgi:hypothetical protein